MKIPKQIKIGHLNYRVLRLSVKKSRDFYGRSNANDQTIELDFKLKKPILEETFFHEIIHAVLDSRDFPKQNRNDHFIRNLSMGLYQTLKDNNLLK